MRVLSFRRTLTAVVVATFALAAFFYARYPGFVSSVVRQGRYATLHENRNLWACIAYWLEFMQKLSFDSNTRTWTFENTPRAGLSDFDSGRLAFHRGLFSEAAS